MPLSKDLLEILACPVGKTELAYDEAAQTLTCQCGLVYPVRDGIPVMLESEAAKSEGYQQNGCTHKASGAP